MSIYDTFNYLYIIMSKLITKEQFQEKLNQKRESLLEQKRQKIEKEVLLILSWIDMSKLSNEEQAMIRKSAKNIAEKKDYHENYKLKILDNIQKNSEEQHFWENIEIDKWLNIYSDISNDVVYKRMGKNGDSENIKLFLERKLDVDTYLSYLTDEELRKIWNEDTFLLLEQLREQAETNDNGIESNENNAEEILCNIPYMPEEAEWAIQYTESNNLSNNEIISKEQNENIENVLKEIEQFIRDHHIKIIDINKLKKKIKRIIKSWNYRKSDFDSFWINEEENGFFEVLERYWIKEFVDIKKSKQRTKKDKKTKEDYLWEIEKAELKTEDLRSYLNNLFTRKTLLKRYGIIVQYNESYYTNFPKDIDELKKFFDAKDEDQLLEIIFWNDVETIEENWNIWTEVVDIEIDDGYTEGEIQDISLIATEKEKQLIDSITKSLTDVFEIDEWIVEEYKKSFLEMRRKWRQWNIVPAWNWEERKQYLEFIWYYKVQKKVFELEVKYPYLTIVKESIKNKLNRK